MELEKMKLSVVTQPQKDKCPMCFLVCRALLQIVSFVSLTGNKTEDGKLERGRVRGNIKGGAE